MFRKSKTVLFGVKQPSSLDPLDVFFNNKEKGDFPKIGEKTWENFQMFLKLSLKHLSTWWFQPTPLKNMRKSKWESSSPIFRVKIKNI